MDFLKKLGFGGRGSSGPPLVALKPGEVREEPLTPGGKPVVVSGPSPGFTVLRVGEQVWAGTQQSGVRILEGSPLREVDRVDFSGVLPTGRVTAMESGTDEVLLGTDRGLVRRTPAGWSLVTFHGPDRESKIRCLHRSARGLWVGTSSGAFLRTAQGAWHALQLPPGQGVYALLDTGDALLAGLGSKGLRAHVGGEWRPTVPCPSVSSLVQDPKGGLWVGTRYRLLHYPSAGAVGRQNPDLVRILPEPEDLPVVGLLHDGESLWVASSETLWRQDGSGWKAADASDPGLRSAWREAAPPRVGGDWPHLADVFLAEAGVGGDLPGNLVVRFARTAAGAPVALTRGGAARWTPEGWRPWNLPAAFEFLWLGGDGSGWAWPAWRRRVRPRW